MLDQRGRRWPYINIQHWISTCSVWTYSYVCPSVIQNQIVTCHTSRIQPRCHAVSLIWSSVYLIAADSVPQNIAFLSGPLCHRKSTPDQYQWGCYVIKWIWSIFASQSVMFVNYWRRSQEIKLSCLDSIGFDLHAFDNRVDLNWRHIIVCL